MGFLRVVNDDGGWAAVRRHHPAAAVRPQAGSVQRADNRPVSLVCEECETTTDVDARLPGWRAYILPVEDTLVDGRRVIVYCPICAAVEFGPLRFTDPA